LRTKHGASALQQWQQRNEQVLAKRAAYEARTLQDHIAPLYRYDYDVKEGKDLQFNAQSLHLRGYAQPINLDLPNPYPDMT
jgi:acetoacetyl-[acyl-carrier protein] synthase